MELPLPELGKAVGRVGAEGRGNKDVGSRPSPVLCTAEVLERRGGTGSAWPPRARSGGQTPGCFPPPTLATVVSMRLVLSPGRPVPGLLCVCERAAASPAQ